MMATGWHAGSEGAFLLGNGRTRLPGRETTSFSYCLVRRAGRFCSWSVEPTTYHGAYMKATWCNFTAADVPSVTSSHVPPIKAFSGGVWKCVSRELERRRDAKLI